MITSRSASEHFLKRFTYFTNKNVLILKPKVICYRRLILMTDIELILS